MKTTAQTLRIVIIDHQTGEAGVAEIRTDRYDLADVETRKELARTTATAALENLNRTDRPAWLKTP